MQIQWEDGELCPVCNHGDTGEAVTLLPCAHKIHEPCLVDLTQAMQCGMDDLKCPVCKKTGKDIVALERQLLSPDRSPPIVDSSDDQASSILGEPVPHSIEDDAFFEACLRAVDEASGASEGECVESESDFVPDPIEVMDVDEFIALRGFDPRTRLPHEALASGGTPTLVAPPPPKFNPVMAAFRRSAASDSLANPETPLASDVIGALEALSRTTVAEQDDDDDDDEPELPALSKIDDDSDDDDDDDDDEPETQDDEPLASLVACAPKLPAAVPKSGRPKSGAANGAAPKSRRAKAVAAPKSGAAKAVPKSGAAKAAVPKSGAAKAAPKAAPKAGAAAAPKSLAAPPAKAPPATAAVPKQAEHLPKSLAAPLAEAAVPKQAGHLDNAIVPADHFVTKAILDRRPQAPPGFARMAIPVPKQQGAETEVLFCNWCNQPVSVANVRVTSKSSSKYKCNKCQSTFVKMHNANGSWPTAAFNAIPNENQIEFYRQAALESKTGEVMKIMDKCLEKYSRREFTWALGGTYYPLSAWKVKGFDAERIEKTSLPEDITWNDQCGWCYRVRLFSATTTGTEGQMMSQRLRATSGDIDAKRPRIGDAAAASSQGETAEAFQERRKQELQARKDADKAANQKKIVASQLLKKLSPPLEQLRQQCSLAQQKSLPCANAIAKLDEASAIKTELEKFTEGVGSESDPVMQKEVRV